MTDKYALPSAQAWFAIAERDVRSARILLQADPPVTEAAAFHCQQAAEKYLKGILAYHAVSPPGSSEIGLLLDQVHPHTKIFEPHRPDGEQLTVFSLEKRSHVVVDPPSVDEASSALQTAERFQEIATGMIQEK